jgi:virginiamycin B lyase
MLQSGLRVVVRAAVSITLLWAVTLPLLAQTSVPALSGRVASQAEGDMEGVIVRAKKAGSTITVSVVSDAQGRYRFPADRLDAGQYAVSVRAAGYMLEGPTSVTIGAQKNATADLKLRMATVDETASQLSDAEWLMSMPGTPQQKAAFRNCNHCHTFERIARSKFDPAAALATIERMSRYSPSSFPFLIQKNPTRRIGGGPSTPESRERVQAGRKRIAEVIASVNLSNRDTWGYELKTLPRPKGKATKVIYTEYDLPAQTRQPHDVVMDSQGYAWYASFGEQILGRLDPKTGAVKEWPIPVLKSNRNAGVLDVELDADENVWVGNGFQNGIQMFDRKNQSWKSYPLPPALDDDHVELLFLAPKNHKVDGKVWVMNNGEWSILRVDLATNKWEKFTAFPLPRPNHYQVMSDSQNNGWFSVMGRNDVGRIDAKTGEIKIWKTDIKDSGPRRGMVDAQDRLWTALNRTDSVSVLDPKTGKFDFYSTGIPEYYAYDVWADKHGEVWTSTEYADRVVRINTNTREAIPYLLPGPTNMRRANGDNRMTPAHFWVGATHTASIVRLEPLD